MAGSRWRAFPARRALDVELTAQALGPLPHAYEAQMRLGSLGHSRVEAGAGIGNFDQSWPSHPLTVTVGAAPSACRQALFSASWTIR